MNEKDAIKFHLSNTFIDEQQLSDSTYAAYLNLETSTCKMPMQDA